MRKRLLLIVLTLLLVGGGFAAWWYYPQPVEPEPPEVRISIPFLTMDSTWADSVLAGMTQEQKIGQLFMVESGSGTIELEDSLTQWIAEYHIGGVHLKEGYLLDQALLVNTLRDTSPTPLFISSDHPTDALKMPDEVHLAAIDNDSLLYEFDSISTHNLRQRGVNLVFGPTLNYGPRDTIFNYQPFSLDTTRTLNEALGKAKIMEEQNVLSCLGDYSDYLDFEFDTLNLRDSILHRYTFMTHQGTPCIKLDNGIRFDNSAKELEANHIKNFMAEYLEFDGLIFSDVLEAKREEDPYQRTLHAGVDVIIIRDSVRQEMELMKGLVQDGVLTEKQLDRKVRKILLAKYWTTLNAVDSVDDKQVGELYAGIDNLLMQRKLYESSITLANNTGDALPFKEIRNDSLLYVLNVGEGKVKDFLKLLPNYTLYRQQRVRTKKDQPLKAVNVGRLRKFDPVIVTINDVKIDTARDKAFMKSLSELDEKTNVVLVNFGNPVNLQYFGQFESILQTYGNAPIEQSTACQNLFGGVPARGLLPMQIDTQFSYRSGIQQEKAVRLKYTIPEEVGIPSDSLKKIDFIAKTVIQRRATPGCQIFIAKEGKVIYHKAFGHHTYARKRPVKLTDLYDLASLTKVTATTLAAMQAYEEQKFKLSDSLEKFLPDSLDFTSLNDITWKEVLTHRTGLSSGMNILKFLQYQNDSVGRLDRFYCDMPDDTIYSLQVADSLWMDTTYADSIWIDLTMQWVNKAKPYKYSDANFNLLYFLLCSINGNDKPFDDYVHQKFYRPLGLQTTCYLPLKKYPTARIVPTEDEKYWRKQLLHGWVHDPTAALMGGVAGNAGLFSNANDVGVIYQMLLNRGTYGGKRYFQTSTVDLFTEKASNGHRGLGFNKPASEKKKGIIAPDAPMSSYGHTGFTGTCVWVDPENDLVYVFLSNRVHPKAMNKKLVQNGTRKRIHQVIYDCILPQEEPIDSVPTQDTIPVVSSLSSPHKSNSWASPYHSKRNERGSFLAWPQSCFVSCWD